MPNSLPRVSIILSISESTFGLEHALDAVSAQTPPDVECLVVDFKNDEKTRALLKPRRENITCIELDTAEPLARLNHAFHSSRGELMLWLDANDRLFAWTCERAAHLFEMLPDVMWLTSVAPFQWTRDQFCIAQRGGIGFSRETFFAGRNLPGTRAFAHPVWRVGTFWRRALWEQSGARVNALLEDAGDFDLWARFWEHAQLGSVTLPFGGRQAATPDFLYTSRYQVAAQRVLAAHPSSLTLYKHFGKIQRRLAFWIPALHARWSTPALHVWNKNMQPEFRATLKPLL